MRRVAAAAVALALAAWMVGCGGAAVDRAGGPVLSLEQEIAIGRAAAPYLEVLAGGRLDDLAVQAYVRTIGERVARSTPMPDLPYQFIVTQGPEMAVFALPGGPVVVTRGLLAALRTEAQLAAALAHPLARINTRHLVGALQRELGKAELLTVAAAGESACAGRLSDKQAETLARFAAAVRQLKADPEADGQADRLGLDYMVAAGYNPRGMTGFLETVAPGDEAGGRAGRIGRAMDRKYGDRGGRVADEEYRREVLDRLEDR
ncbi:MAG TPA: M48 family metalloprotease [Phycisphaerae bacterium]|nr:M48 family metalloprotease [Phycisphaerae bacterium]